MFTVPVRRALPNGIKLSGPSISFSGATIKGVPSDCDRCALFRDVKTFSISCGLSNFAIDLKEVIERYYSKG